MAFDPGGNYRVRGNADSKRKPNGCGEAVRLEMAGIGRGVLDVKDLKSGYAWYETPWFRPVVGTRVSVSPGHRSGSGGGSEAIECIRVDRMEIVRAGADEYSQVSQ